MLYYFKIEHGNFGDALNPWLWSKLAPELCDPNDPRLFLAIGTILNHRVPEAPVKIVFGSGCSPDSRLRPDGKWFFYGVRGPRTAAKIGLPADRALFDPAILVRRVVPPPPQKLHRVAFMPHHQSAFEADWPALCERAGFFFIDPRRDVDWVLTELQRTDLLLTEAMHGAIVADALRVPWIPVRLYGQIVEFKWLDWAESLRIELRMNSVPPIYDYGWLAKQTLPRALKKTVASLGLGKAKWRRLSIGPSSPRAVENTLDQLKDLAANGAPQLSTDQAIQQAEARLFEALTRIRSDWASGKPNP